VFGPVVTLQNVAVISSMQKTPVVGATVGVDWTGRPPNCCTLDDVASCAAAGDAAKSNADFGASLSAAAGRGAAASDTRRAAARNRSARKPHPQSEYTVVQARDGHDGVIEASVVIGNIRYTAVARVLSSCPDYAPDRRPFFSMADDLADRDLPAIDINADPPPEAAYEVADLFERAFETASLFNLDAMRTRAVLENIANKPFPGNKGLPEMDHRSMTAKDRGLKDDEIGHKVPPYANTTADLFPYPPKPNSGPGFRLPYSAVAQFAHAKLCDVETMIDFLSTNSSRVKKLVRPPFARFPKLAQKPKDKSTGGYRDPRITRDQFHDMRMPPYMRDSDQNPLSISHRQYDELMQLVEYLMGPAGRESTPIARVVAGVVSRVRKSESEA
jgi:hypothetical protein